MARKNPPEPRPRGMTAREQLRRALRGRSATGRELSVELGIREKEVIEHLEHLARSLPHRGERLRIEPAVCLACGYVFRDRKRLSRPGACPKCRSTHVDAPAFRIE